MTEIKSVKDSMLEKSINKIKERVEKLLEQNGVVTAQEFNDMFNEELGINQPWLRTDKLGFTESPFKEK